MVRRLQFSALLCRVENLLQQIRSITQIWVVTRGQYGISALVSQTSFRGGKPVLMSWNVSCFLRPRNAGATRALEYYLFLDTASDEQSALRSQSKRQLPALVESRTRHLETLQSWAIIHQGFCLLYSRLLKEAAAHVDKVSQAVQFKKQ